jgi:hypothetical protein
VHLQAKCGDRRAPHHGRRSDKSYAIGDYDRLAVCGAAVQVSTGLPVRHASECVDVPQAPLRHARGGRFATCRQKPKAAMHLVD